MANKPPLYKGRTSNTPSRDVLIARLAATQHGLVRLDQLRALGLDHRAVSERVKHGRLHRIYRAVYAVGHAALSREAEWLAAVLASGSDAGLGARSVGEFWGVARKRVPHVEVVVPQKRRAQGTIRLLVSRTLVPGDIVRHRGIPVTHTARMFVDLTDTNTPHQLANVIYEAAFHKRFSEPATRAAMARATGRQKLGVLEQALALNASGSAGTRSDLEDAFLAIVDGAGLPEPLVNTPTLDVEPDFRWSDRRLVVEVDGPGHARERARRNDARCERILRDAGYAVVRFSHIDVEHRHGFVIQTLRDALDL
ncbi:type IV toxin-antitoxin system AbiEi family antitoxin domain-containing protein [Solirubrobacter soli]|uniref:type IV toxin-antitoxin system AbiEi family antitoxin domain-containing protein n=1 Tax=Solirubrobacter soli TaxID=363832 RepID=UPI000485FCF2|nr:type IV toxin-antitoxin system AbiEi family antitoxin domain-containing protein [Solirubrobacter soli]